MMVVRLLSYWEGSFSGAMLNFQGVTHKKKTGGEGNLTFRLTSLRSGFEEDVDGNESKGKDKKLLSEIIISSHNSHVQQKWVPPIVVIP